LDFWSGFDNWLKSMPEDVLYEKHGNRWVAEALRGTDIATDKGYLTLLRFALENNLYALAKEMAKVGTDVEYRSLEGIGPFPPNLANQTDLDKALLKAAEYGWFSPMAELFQKGANIHATNEDGLTTMEIIARNGRIDGSLNIPLMKKVKELFFERAVNYDRARVRLALHEAILNDDVLGVERLLELVADPNNDRDQLHLALHEAIRNEDVLGVQLLLELGADPRYLNADEQNALTLAIQFNGSVDGNLPPPSQSSDRKRLQIFQLLTGS